MQMKSENLIHMKANSKRLICRRRSLNVSTAVLAVVMQMKCEYLIYMKAKSECLKSEMKIAKVKSELLRPKKQRRSLKARNPKSKCEV